VSWCLCGKHSFATACLDGLIVHKGQNDKPILLAKKSPSPVKPKRGIIISIAPLPLNQGRGFFVMGL
jgi:hypothetical protein